MKIEIEGTIQRYLLNNTISAWTGIQLVPPTRQYSTDELNSIIRENGIDSVLIVGLTEYWTSQQYIPQSSTINGSATIIGNTISYAQQTNTYGGFNISKPRMSFESRLFDAKTGNVVWMSTSLTRGNAFAKFVDLASSLSTSIVNRLWNEKIIAKTSTRPAADSETIPNASNYNTRPSEKRNSDKMRIVKSGAVLRIKPDEKSEVIMNLPIGALFDLDERLEDWVKIRIVKNQDGFTIIGYVHVSFIEILETR
jgi:hypothetical protein